MDDVVTALERGDIVVGGNRGGRTWAAALIAARPAERRHDHSPDFATDLRPKTAFQK